ncbi:MAG TPA: hypothetical protein VLI92_04165 [Candidatus Saccharimonadales bacterium]|nr:hypothetical protein [Candidatus Saccharimonadales bacterium]
MASDAATSVTLARLEFDAITQTLKGQPKDRPASELHQASQKLLRQIRDLQKLMRNTEMPEGKRTSAVEKAVKSLKGNLRILAAQHRHYCKVLKDSHNRNKGHQYSSSFKHLEPASD